MFAANTGMFILGVVGYTEYLHMPLFQAFLNRATLTGKLFYT